MDLPGLFVDCSGLLFFVFGLFIYFHARHDEKGNVNRSYRRPYYVPG